MPLGLSVPSPMVFLFRHRGAALIVESVPLRIVPARQLMYNEHRWLSSNGGHKEKAGVKCRPVGGCLHQPVLAMAYLLAAYRSGPAGSVTFGRRAR